MFAGRIRFALATLGIYVAWTLLSGRVLALTPMGTTWMYALNGLLLGLMPLAYQLAIGRRPGRPQPVALGCGAIALAAAIVCANRLDAVFSGSTRLVALAAGYALGVCWYAENRRMTALSAVLALALAGLGAGLLYALQRELTSSMTARSLSMHLPTYFDSAIAFAFGLALPLPRIARRAHVPLAVAAVQLTLIIAALLRYGGAVSGGFADVAARLTMTQTFSFSFCLYVGIAGMLVRQALYNLSLDAQPRRPSARSLGGSSAEPTT